MKSLVLPLPGNETLARRLAEHLGAEVGTLESRRFPDGESYLRILSPVEGRRVTIAGTLNDPDRKILPLGFLASTCRELGALETGLAAPYLAYMRQDARFNPGEAVSSRPFAKMLSAWVDWLVTVDPHLHRYGSLGEIYSIPAAVIRAAPLVSAWIGAHVERPLVVGPDGESEQWVSEVARGAKVPHIVLQKVRLGDRDVEVSVPEVARWQGRTPVLVDDIISTAHTMMETVRHLRRAGLAPPVCIGIHGIFSGTAYEDLIAAGASRIVTCNTIAHSSNTIDVSGLLAEEIRRFQGPR